MNLGKGINKLFMDYWVLAPIPKDTKHYPGPEVGMGLWKLGDQWRCSSSPSHSGSSGSINPPYFFPSPVLQFLVGIGILNNWQNPHMSTLTHGVGVCRDTSADNAHSR